MSVASDIKIGLREIEREQALTLSYLGTDYDICASTHQRGQQVEWNGRAVDVERSVYLRADEYPTLAIDTLAGKVVVVGSLSFRVVRVGLDPTATFFTLDLADVASGR